MPTPNGSSGDQPTKKSTSAKKATTAKKTTGTKKSTSPKKTTGPTKATTTKKATGPTKATTTKKATRPTKATGTKKATGLTTSATSKRGTPRPEDAPSSRFWSGAQRRAENLLKDPDKLGKLLEEAEGKPTGGKRGRLSEVLEELKALLRLIRAYIQGDYRDVSWENMVLIVAAVVYFVSPVDLIPDFIPVAGYADDAVVVAWVLKLVREEVDDFLKWEATH